MVALRAFDCVSRRGVSARQTPSFSCASRSQLSLQELVFENPSRPVSSAKKGFWQAKHSVRATTMRREAFAAPFHPPPGDAV